MAHSTSAPDGASPLPESRVDGCPHCVYNYELPHRIVPGEGGFNAHYRCADCATTWITSWSDR